MFRRIKDWLFSNSIIMIVIAIIVIMVLFVPGFTTWNNIQNVLEQLAVYGISAVGLTYVMVTGNMDLSIGAMLSFAAVVGAIVMTSIVSSVGLIFGIFIIIAVGIGIGALNGLIVSLIGVNAFMMTLITSMLFEGLGIWITQAHSVGGLPESFEAIGTTTWGLPITVYIMLIVFVVGEFILKKTAFGRELFAVGANRDAARLVGIPVKKVLFTVFVISGFFSGIAGIMLSSKLGVASASMGGFLQLDIVSAVIIGGTSLFGGKGSVTGTAFGVLLLGLISNGLTLLGVSYYATMVVKGVVILLAVVADAAKEKIDLKKMLKS